MFSFVWLGLTKVSQAANIQGNILSIMLDSGLMYTRKSVQFQFYFLQTRHSNVRQVTLRKVSLLTSGVYRCEVTSKLSPAGIDSEVKEDRLVVLGEFQH